MGTLDADINSPELPLPLQTEVRRTCSSSPPLHVHVPEARPVHVHMKKKKKSAQNSFAVTSQMNVRDMKVHSETGTLQTTARSKLRAPWVPPGRASIRDVSFKVEAEEALHGRINQYERKISSLMMEVGSLKKQVALQRKGQLDASQYMNEKREEEQREVTKELEVREMENGRLHQSLVQMQVENHNGRRDANSKLGEQDVLLRMLTAVEMDGEAMTEQVSALQETVSGMRRDKRLSQAATTLLGQQRALLMQKLETFRSSSRSLRCLLREQHGQETGKLSGWREVLVKKLADTETQNLRLVAKLREKEKELEQTVAALESEKQKARSTGELCKVLESTHAHMQGQLCIKEAENSRLAAEIQDLEQTLRMQQKDMEQLKGQPEELRQWAERDAEALRRAKRRVERSEDVARWLKAQLAEKDSQLADAQVEVESWRCRQAQAEKDKSQLEMAMAALNTQLTDLKDQLQSAEDKARVNREELLDRLHCLTSDSAGTRLENQRLKADLSVQEQKLMASQSESQQLKAVVEQFEKLVDSYRSQLQKECREVQECGVRLQLAEEEAQAARVDLDHRAGDVRRLLDRLTALEPLPGLLRRSELQLREAEGRIQEHERCSALQSRALAELRLKVEQQGEQTKAFQEKAAKLHKENRRLKQTLENLEKKLEEAGSQNQDLLRTIAKREETIHSGQLRLEEKTQECSTLSRQLEGALGDARPLVAKTSEWAISREHSSQSKVLDLESQLRPTKSELTRLWRGKDEAERQLQNRVEDSTNRGLQNYIPFLKTSYTNVYGDSSLPASII